MRSQFVPGDGLGMKKAFIVGITGFVGSHLAEYLLEREVQVLGCSRSAKWRHGAPLSLAAEIPVFSWELQQPFPPGAQQQVESFQPDWIFHLGAMTIPNDCGRDEPTPEAWGANVEGTSELCRLALMLPNRPRVVFSSSCHVYAPVKADQPFVNESDRTGPTTAYGTTKLEAENRFSAAVEQGMNGIVARAFHHTGPRQSPRMVLPDWARQLVRDDEQPVQVHTFDAFLDLSDVRDIVSAYHQLAEKGETGETFNVGSGVCRRSGDIFQQLLKMSADPEREVTEVSPGRRQQPIADTKQIKQVTGWKPRIPFDRTLADTLHYWQELADTGRL